MRLKSFLKPDFSNKVFVAAKLVSIVVDSISHLKRQ